MFERVGRAAERVATGVSRRAFLGRLGKGALATAGVVAGMLALGGKAEAIIASRCYGLLGCGSLGNGLYTTCCRYGQLCCQSKAGAWYCSSTGTCPY
jgi:hypothetical protein